MHGRFQVTSHIVGIFTLHFVSTIELLWLYQFIQFLTCTRISCRDSHCENGLVRCCLYTTHNLEIHCLSDRCHRAVALLSSHAGPGTATVVSLDESTQHIRRMSHEPWQHDALAVKRVAELLLKHAHIGSGKALDPSPRIQKNLDTLQNPRIIELLEF